MTVSGRLHVFLCKLNLNSIANFPDSYVLDSDTGNFTVGAIKLKPNFKKMCIFVLIFVCIIIYMCT